MNIEDLPEERKQHLRFLFHFNWLIVWVKEHPDDIAQQPAMAWITKMMDIYAARQADRRKNRT